MTIPHHKQPRKGTQIWTTLPMQEYRVTSYYEETDIDSLSHDISNKYVYVVLRVH